MRIPKEVMHDTYIGDVNGHEIKLDISFTLGDYGIGSYEFWGEKGYDSRIDIDECWADRAWVHSLSGKSARPIDPGSTCVELLLEEWAEHCDWERLVDNYNEEEAMRFEY